MKNTTSPAPTPTLYAVTIDTRGGPVTSDVTALTYRDAHKGAIEEYFLDPDAFILAALRDRF